MKHPNTRFALLVLAALAPAGLTTAPAQSASSRDPIVITPPAVQNGSNWSRAPFTAARRFDDVRPADGQAIDLNTPPNTRATDPEPFQLPYATVAILQPGPSPYTEPMLTPTGRPTVFAAAAAGSRDPIVITPPAVQNGSNWSRAPFPAARRFDDVRPSDGQAVDQNVPPNTPATDPEPHPLPEPPVAILQPAWPLVTEPALLPTGRPTVGVAASLDTTQTVAAIQAGAHASREQLVADIEARMKTVDTAMRNMRGSMREMNADARAAFRAAEDEIKQAERSVRNSLRAVRRASAAEWEPARTQLASDFQAYAAALARLDAAAGIAPAVR